MLNFIRFWGNQNKTTMRHHYAPTGNEQVVKSNADVTADK